MELKETGRKPELEVEQEPKIEKGIGAEEIDIGSVSITAGGRTEMEI